VLAHEVIGTGPRLVVFLHGILGSKNNWRSFAKRFVDARGSEVRAVIADLRNHGDSHGPELAPPHTVEACAEDVVRLIRPPRAVEVVSGRSRALGSTTGAGTGVVVVGHSYGGKVALQLAKAHPDVVDEVWSLDAPPGARSWSGSGDVERVVTAVSSLPLPIASRKALVEQLREHGLSEPLAQWMTTNLKPVDTAGQSGFAWKFDLAALPEMLSSFGGLDLWPWLESHRGPPRVVLVRAERGARYSDDDVKRAESNPEIAFRTLENAGHWLHTDNPDGLLRMMLAEMA
jgi:pimeloyl-ACP methyl ester carboxylesterase